MAKLFWDDNIWLLSPFTTLFRHGNSYFTYKVDEREKSYFFLINFAINESNNSMRLRNDHGGEFLRSRAVANATVFGRNR